MYVVVHDSINFYFVGKKSNTHGCERMMMKLEISRIGHNENTQHKQKQFMLVDIWRSNLVILLSIETGAWIPDAKQPKCTRVTNQK